VNHYGAMAMRHWRTHLPERFAQLNDPDTFFAEMGERVATRVRELEVTLAGPDTPGEEYLEKLGRLTNAKMRAEEIVLPEEVLAAPPETAETAQEYTDEDWDVWTEEDRARNRRASAQQREREQTGWNTEVIPMSRLLQEEQDNQAAQEIHRRSLTEQGIDPGWLDQETAQPGPA
jgi:hypothetical protein